MPADLRLESDGVYVLRISGTLLRSEFGNAQDEAAIAIDAGVKPRILTILENFEGFERADWGDIESHFLKFDEIAKIAIVSEPSWEPKALAFADAGFRRTPVKFFPVGQEPQARAWLTE